MIDKNRIENAVREILIAIGEDPNRDGLLETPKRVSNMYEEIFMGIDRDPLLEAKVFREDDAHETIVVKDIPTYSMCEHHLLPFFGVVHVAYLPNNSNVLGLSKIARIVDVISRRPQLQERLCSQVSDAIMESADALGVMVIMECEHLCMTMRGIKKFGAKTVTVSSNGVFKTDSAYRNEAMTLLKL